MKLHRGPFFLIVEGLLRALLIYSFLLSGLIIPQAEVQAAWPAADDAADKAYTNSTVATPATAVLTNGSNGGSGWQEWQLTPAVNHPTAGFTNRSSTINGIAPVIDSGAGFAWGMYADAGKTNLALRLFTNNVPMNVGQQLAVEMAPGLIGPNGTNGVELVNAGTNALLRLFFTHDLATGAYHITDGSGTAKPYPSAYGFTNGFQFVFALTNADSGVLLLDDGSIQTNHPVTLIRAVGGQQIVGARLFGYGTGRGVTNFFNSLRLGCIDFPTCTLPPSMNVSSNYTFTGAVGYSNLWQVIDVNGCGVTAVPADATNNPTLTVQSPLGCKQYDLVLTVLSNGCSATCTSHVSVVNRRRQAGSGCATAVVSGDASICSNGTTTIKATLTGQGVWDVTWQDGVGGTNFVQSNVGSTVASRLVNPTASMTYTVVGLTDWQGPEGVGPGCTAWPVDLTGSATVTVNSRPTAVVSGTANVCSNSSATITATLTGTGPYNLNWSDGVTQNGVVSPATRSVTPSATTTYTLLSVTDNNGNGCQALPTGLTGSAVITVRALPTAQVSLEVSPTTICASVATNVFAVMTGTGPTTYNLTWSDGVTENGVTSPHKRVVTPGLTTTYTLTSVKDNGTGCNAQLSDLTGSALVTVTPLPTAVVGTDASICSGKTATVTASLTGTGPWNLTWTAAGGGDTNFGPYTVNTSPATRIVRPTKTTTYTLSTLVDQGAACSNSPVNNLGAATITVNPLPNANITLNVNINGGFCSNTLYNPGASVPDAGPGASYSWSFVNATPVDPSKNPVAFTTASGIVSAQVTVVDGNGCTSTQGLATATIFTPSIIGPTNVPFRAYIFDRFTTDFTTRSEPYPVVLSNSAIYSVIIQSYTYAGLNGGDYTLTTTTNQAGPLFNPVNLPLAAGGQTNFWVTFKPGRLGDRSDTLVFSTSDPCFPHVNIPLVNSAGKVCPVLDPLPPGSLGYAEVTFGDLSLVQAPKTQYLIITNSGPSEMVIGGGVQLRAYDPTLGQAVQGTGQGIKIVETDSGAAGCSGLPLFVVGDPRISTITGDHIAGTGTACTNNWDVVDSLGNINPNGGIPGDGVVIPAGGTCSIPVTFWTCSALVTGKYSATVTFAGDFCSQDPSQYLTHEITFQVKGQATAPLLQIIDPGQSNNVVGLVTNSVQGMLQFPPTTVNFASAPMRVLVQNTGDGPMTINPDTDIHIISTNAQDFTVVSDSCGVLQPGDTCGVTITFKPGALGPRNATFIIRSDDATNTPNYFNNFPIPPVYVNVPLRGTGAEGVPSIGLSPTSLNFPNTAQFGTSASQTITVTNGGTVNLVISTNLFNVSNNGRGTNVFSGGNGTNDFAVASTTCAGLPISIAPGTSCGINVVFNPTNTGSRSTWLQIFSNSGTNVPFAMNATNQILVTGYSTAPAITLVPNRLDFGTNAVGAESAPLVVAVENTGNGPLILNNVSQASIVGTNAADFLYYGDTCAGNPVAPGNNCGITVRFKPSLTNSETATLLLISNITDGNGQPVTNAIPLTGVGTANAPLIGVTPTSLSFGDQPLGTTSAPPVSLTITNGGTAAMLITNISVSTSEFVVTPVAGALNTLILPSASVTVNVQFAPTNTGTRAGNINVYWNNGSATPTSVPVLGSGTAPGLTPLPSSVTFTNTAQPIGVTSAAQLVLLHNSGSAPLTITGVTVVGTNTADFAASLAGCGSVPPGGDCLLSVTFTPGATNGLRTAALRIASNATNAPPVDIPVFGLGTNNAPSLDLAPASLNFNNVNVGTTSVVQSVTVNNNGSAALVITNIESATSEFVAGSLSCLNVPIAPGAHCTLNIAFAPTNSGAKSSVVRIWNNTSVNPAPVTVSGVGAAPLITPLPATVVFGSVPVSATSTGQIIQVQNTGLAPLTLSSVTVVGPGSNNFLATPVGCTTVPPGGNCSVTVVFAPTALGVTNATLLLAGNADNSPVSVPLSGTGVASAPVLRFNPTLLPTFGNVSLGTTSLVQAVTVTNAGTAALVISNVTLAGNNPGDFILDPPNTCVGVSILPGGTCTISVRFTPTVSGNRGADVVVTNNAGVPQSFPVKGAGIAPVISLTPPASIDFGTQTVAVVTAPQWVVAKNTGDGPLTITSITFISTNAPDFALVQNNCLGSSIQPGDTCLLGITFTPGAALPRTGTLVIDSNGTNGEQRIHLSGVGSAVTNGPAIDWTPANLNFPNTTVGATSVVQSVTVTNHNTAPLVITNVDLSVAGEFIVSTVGCLNTPLVPGAICTVNVAFTPTNSGAHASFVRIWNNTGLNPAQIPVNGIGAAPTITPQPATLAFGNQPVSVTSTALIVQVQNTGIVPLSLSSATVIGPNAADFTATPIGCATVPPGGSCGVSVVFTPGAAAAETATLVLTGNADNSPVNVPLSGTGVPSAPLVVFNPALLPTFGNVGIGSTSAVQSVTVINAGTSSLVISNVALGGNNPGDFILDSTCVGVSILPGGTCTINVKFKPTAGGNRGANVVVTDNAAGSPHSFSVKGAGVAPVILISTPSLDFGTQAVNVASSPQWVQVSNTGNGPLTITSVTVISTNAPDFSVVVNNCLGVPIQPGNSCLIGINFTAGAALPRTGTLVIDSNGTNGEQRIHLSGVGANEAPTLGINPTSLVFGDTAVGSTSLVQSVTVNNLGTAALVISSLSFTNLATGATNEFLVVSNSCVGASIAPSNSCTIQVAFAPTASGLTNSNLRILSNAGNGTNYVPVQSSGVAPVLFLSTSTLNFGTNGVNVTSPAQPVYALNVGNSPVTISNITVSGINPGDFQLTNNSCAGAILLPGQGCEIDVTFRTLTTLARSGLLTITSDATNSPQVVALNGYGLPCSAIVVSPFTLVDGVVGQAYSQTLSNAGGASPFTFSVATGALPTGLILGTNGTLSGTPSVAGSYSFTVQVHDSLGCIGSRSYTVLVNCPTITLAPAILTTNIHKNAVYTQTLTATNGAAPYTFTVAAGTLPDGLALSPSGLLSGTATNAGNFTYTIQAKDAFNCTGTRTYTVIVFCPSITLAPAIPVTNILEFAVFNQTITASNGVAPYTFSVSAGALPNGLQLSAGGLVSGMATNVGDFTYTIQARDANHCVGTYSYTVSVGCPFVGMVPGVMANGFVGIFYNHAISATNGTSPYTFQLLSGTVPTGLTLASSGALTGTPTTVGSYTFTVVAQDAHACIGTYDYTIGISCPTITFAPSLLRTAIVEELFIQKITATNGTAPYAFSLVAGQLPTGLHFTAGGTLTGTPMQVGNFPVTVQAIDANGCAGTTNYVLTSSCRTLTMTPTNAPNSFASFAYAGSPYSQAFVVVGSSNVFTYAVTSGSLPTGLALSSNASTGTVRGVPTVAGFYWFTITGTDPVGCSARQDYGIYIECPSVSFSPSTLPAATANSPYDQSIVANGATAPLSYHVTSGAVPPGLNFISDGELVGTPTVNGTYTFTVTETDADNCISSHTYTLVVDCGTLALSPTTLPNPAVGVSYSNTVTVAGRPSGLTFVITGGSLPPGLRLSSLGVLSGTPILGGAFTFKVTAIDPVNGCSGSRFYTLNIGCAALALTPTLLPVGGVGSYYSQTLTASGGRTNYVYTQTSGSLPSGLTLITTNGVCVLSGVPTSGSSIFGIKVTDANGCSTTVSYTLILSNTCPIVISPASLPDGDMDTSYYQNITGSGGTAPYTFAVASGTLPVGLTLTTSNSLGMLMGQPQSSGSFVIVGTDANGCVAANSYTINVACSVIKVSPSTLATGMVGVAYQQSLTTVGGVTPVNLAIRGLPAGLTSDSTGAIVGTPTASGTFALAVTATDAANCSTSVVCSLTINPSVDLGVTLHVAPDPVVVGASNLTYTIVVTNYSVTPANDVTLTNTLPAGVTVLSTSTGCTNANGLVSCDLGTLAGGASQTLMITGTASVAGSLTNTVTVQSANFDLNSANNSATLVSAAGSVAQFIAPRQLVSASAGQAVVTVVRLGDPTVAASVQYNTSDNSALAGVDYTATAGALTFSPGDMNRSFVVPLLSKAGSKAGKTVKLSLHDPVGVMLDHNSTALLTIIAKGANPAFVFTNAAGDVVTVQLTGAGTMQYSLVDPAVGPIDQILLTGTDATSSLSIAVKRGRQSTGFVDVGSIVGGSLKSLNAAGVNLVGDGINLSGNLGTLLLNSVHNSKVNVQGNLGTMSVNVLAGALVAAGYTPANAAAPLAGGTYAGTWQIKSLTAKSVANSTVAAAQIGKLQFKAVTTANAGVAFGVRARDGIGAVAITKPKFNWKRAGASDQSSGDFHVILP